MAKGKGTIISKVIMLLVLSGVAFTGYWAYENLYKSNVHLDGKKYTYIYITNGSTFEDLLEELYSQNLIKDHESFEWMAHKMELPSKLNAGKYRIDAKMSNRSIIKMIINHKEEKVKLYFNSQIRTKENFINYISEKLVISQAEIEDFCNNENLLQDEFGLNSDNMMCLVVPETYELSWATSIEELTALLKKTYHAVWTKERKQKANNIGYSISETIIIASITQSESIIKTEQQKIAGVYINRLHQDMKLQADPTIVFANGNFEVHRVLSADKDIDSPYNTYMYKGLPPGPICLVNPSTIDAVLNYTKSNYLFFCAKPDFSSYSSFSNSYEVHQKNAKAYQEALNKKGIKR